ncbi:hypothetical protein Taro_002081 [Colocasia esculenta]|uniref:Uncharacterized protein n=1 Tax=Colocasia esculenta TaxID=4460 RepID=A0A843TMJ3_COLES|nr:hypothetical protein [Colocasia esculenta]
MPAGLVLVTSQLCRFCGDCPACSLFARCSALEGLSHLEVVSVSWDPHPRELVEGVLQATSVLELAAHTSRSLEFLTQTRQSFVSLPLSALVPEPRSGARREAAAWPGCGVACVGYFCGGSISPFARAEAGARLVSGGRGQRVPLLAASGRDLVAVVVTAFSSRRFQVFLVARACTAVIAWLCLVSVGVVGLALGRPVLLVVPASVFSWFRGLVLGCQPVMAPACVASRPGGVSGVRGPFRARFCYCCATSESEMRCWFGWCILEGFSQSGALVVLVEVLPGPACVASAVLLIAVSFLMVRVVWLFGLCILVKVLPRIALCRLWWRFFPGVLCVCFGPPLCCPCGSKCAVWLGCVLVRFSQDGSWRFWWRFSPKLLRVVVVVAAHSLSVEMSCRCLPVGLSVLQSAWALSVKVLCAWPCVWPLRWPAGHVSHFQVFSAVPVDSVYPRGAGGRLHFRCAERCFRFVPDSVGFCGSRVCATTLVGGRSVVLFSSAG